MADYTPIEWADATVNYINGCSLASPGCSNCYAMKLAGTRLKHHESRKGLTVETKTGPVWNGEIRAWPPALLQPLRWRRPRVIFWNAHGDLFHPNVADETIDRQFAVMIMTHQHKHLILTKRSERMREYLSRHRWHLWSAIGRGLDPARWDALPPIMGGDATPVPNVWLGVSIEDRDRMIERAYDLKETPAAGRFWSAEPLLGDLGYIPPAILPDGVIAGGESGPRPMHPDWVRNLRDQCMNAGVDFHFKQWGSWVPLRNYGGGHWPTDTGGCIRLTVDGRRADDGHPMQKVGKKHAGRILDGVTHDALPWRRPA